MKYVSEFFNSFVIIKSSPSLRHIYTFYKTCTSKLRVNFFSSIINHRLYYCKKVSIKHDIINAYLVFTINLPNINGCDGIDPTINYRYQTILRFRRFKTSCLENVRRWKENFQTFQLGPKSVYTKNCFYSYVHLFVF